MPLDSASERPADLNRGLAPWRETNAPMPPRAGLNVLNSSAGEERLARREGEGREEGARGEEARRHACAASRSRQGTD